MIATTILHNKTTSVMVVHMNYPSQFNIHSMVLAQQRPIHILKNNYIFKANEYTTRLALNKRNKHPKTNIQKTNKKKRDFSLRLFVKH